MKKIIALLLTLIFTVTCFAACGGNNDGATADEATKDEANSNQLVIATSPDFPPFEYLNGNEVVGIEIDILKLICEELDKELVIKQMNFDSVLPGIITGKYDVGVSGITINDARKKNSLFTAPYYEAAQAIVVVEGSPIASKADLEGKKISCQSGTTAESYCMENDYNISPFTNNPAAQKALTDGGVDAWVIDNLTAIAMVEAYNAQNDKKLVILDEYMTTEPYGFALAFGNEELVAEMDALIKGWVADGTIEAIFTKYGEKYEAPKA